MTSHNEMPNSLALRQQNPDCANLGVTLNTRQETDLSNAMRADWAGRLDLLRPHAFDKAALQIWIDAGKPPVQLGELHVVATPGRPVELMIKPTPPAPTNQCKVTT